PSSTLFRSPRRTADFPGPPAMGPAGVAGPVGAVAAGAGADAVRARGAAGLARRSAGGPDAGPRRAAQRRGDHGVRGDGRGDAAGGAAAGADAAAPGRDPGDVAAELPRVVRGHGAAVAGVAHRARARALPGSGAPVHAG